jgi:hypothetical protein
MSPHRISAGKPHHDRVVLAGAEVVLVDLDIVPLAGELPWVGDGVGGRVGIKLAITKAKAETRKRPDSAPTPRRLIGQLALPRFCYFTLKRVLQTPSRSWTVYDGS